MSLLGRKSETGKGVKPVSHLYLHDSGSEPVKFTFAVVIDALQPFLELLLFDSRYFALTCEPLHNTHHYSLITTF